jgi:hypothetical protein
LQVATWLLAVQGLLLGLMVLFYGRRSFWVFASVFGFVLGLSLATNFGAGLPAWAEALLAIVLGGAGAWLAFRAPRPIAAVVGGILLALIAFALAAGANLAEWLRWVIAVAVGVLGFYLFWRVLDWALIFATSLFGAGIAALSLSSLFGFTRVLGLLPFALLLVAGIVYQRRDQAQAVELKRARARSQPVESGGVPAAALPAPDAEPDAALALPAPDAALAMPDAALDAALDAEPDAEPDAVLVAQDAPVEPPADVAVEEPAAALPDDDAPPDESPSALNPAV